MSAQRVSSDDKAKPIEIHGFTYLSSATSSAMGKQRIGITLRHEEGAKFSAMIRLTDAKQLLADLSREVRVADQNRNGEETADSCASAVAKGASSLW